MEAVIEASKQTGNLCTRKELAKWLGISDSSFRSYMAVGLIPDFSMPGFDPPRYSLPKCREWLLTLPQMEAAS